MRYPALGLCRTARCQSRPARLAMPPHAGSRFGAAADTPRLNERPFSAVPVVACLRAPSRPPLHRFPLQAIRCSCSRRSRPGRRCSWPGWPGWPPAARRAEAICAPVRAPGLPIHAIPVNAPRRLVRPPHPRAQPRHPRAVDVSAYRQAGVALRARQDPYRCTPPCGFQPVTSAHLRSGRGPYWANGKSSTVAIFRGFCQH